MNAVFALKCARNWILPFKLLTSKRPPHSQKSGNGYDFCETCALHMLTVTTLG